jgi:hypothetical protein
MILLIQYYCSECLELIRGRIVTELPEDHKDYPKVCPLCKENIKQKIITIKTLSSLTRPKREIDSYLDYKFKYGVKH